MDCFVVPLIFPLKVSYILWLCVGFDELVSDILVIVILLICSTAGHDGYMCVMGPYVPSSSWYFPASLSASTFNIASVDISPLDLVP